MAIKWNKREREKERENFKIIKNAINNAVKGVPIEQEIEPHHALMEVRDLSISFHSEVSAGRKGYPEERPSEGKCSR